MSWTDFIASLVGSLAWPVAIVGLVLIFRRQLLGLLEAPIKRLKVGPGGLELEQWERGTALVAGSVAAANIDHADGQEDEADRLMALAATSPEAAIVESFALIEREIRSIAADAGIEDTDHKVATVLADAILGAGGIITEASVDGVRGLATLRDLAAIGWGERMTVARAVEYVTLARALLYALRSARRG